MERCARPQAPGVGQTGAAAGDVVVERAQDRALPGCRKPSGRAPSPGRPHNQIRVFRRRDARRLTACCPRAQLRIDLAANDALARPPAGSPCCLRGLLRAGSANANAVVPAHRRLA